MLITTLNFDGFLMEKTVRLQGDPGIKGAEGPPGLKGEKGERVWHLHDQL